MGDGAASGSLKRADAGGAVGVAAGDQAGLDVGDALDSLTACWRIKIGIKHAGAPAELKLEADAFTDLQRRLAETLDELAGGEAEDVATDLRRLRCGRLRLWGRSLGAGGAASDQQGCCKN